MGAGIDSGNRNAQLSDTLPAGIAPHWEQSPVCPSGGAMTANSISVSGAFTIVAENGDECGAVSAYDTSTGALTWRRHYDQAGRAIVHGAMVYVRTEQGSTRALNLATGTQRWRYLGGNEQDHITAGSGLMVIGNRTANAINGEPWLGAPIIDHGTLVTPLVSGGRIYVNGPTGITAVHPPTGSLLWGHYKPDGGLGAGGGVASPALHNGLLYVRSDQPGKGTLVLNASHGTPVRTLPGSDQPIAFDGRIGVFTTQDPSGATPTTVSAVDLITGHVHWTHTLPTGDVRAKTLSAAPVIANGLVWYIRAEAPGRPADVIALDEVTGAVRSHTIPRCGSGAGKLVVAQQRLFVSTACGVQTFVGVTAPQPAPATPGNILNDPGFERGMNGFSAHPSATATRRGDPVASGRTAVTVMPKQTAQAGRVGLSTTFARAHLPKDATLQFECRVKPLTSNLSLALAVTGSGQTHGSAGSSFVPAVATGSWTKLSVRGGAGGGTGSFTYEVYSPNSSATTGGFAVDDCSIVALR